MVDIRLMRKLKRNISLHELKEYAEGPLDGFRLLGKGNRLSVMPVEKPYWDFILGLE